MNDLRGGGWKRPFLAATIISIFILVMFYYWFGIANRHSIFLYGHVTVGIPSAQPFDEMTRSRYWMAGLVASGMVMLGYITINWLLGRIAVRQGTTYAPPAWWHVWLIAAIPITIGIPAITMTVNEPTLPPLLAASCVIATLLGLIVALFPGKWAAERPMALVWLIADGFGLMPALLLLRVIELPGRGLSVSPTVVWIFSIGSIVGGIVWLSVMTWLRIWQQQDMPRFLALLLSGFGWSYLLMPVVHYWLATPPAYRYISTASNFFAFEPGVQILTFAVALGLAWGTTIFRRKIVRKALQSAG